MSRPFDELTSGFDDERRARIAALKPTYYDRAGVPMSRQAWAEAMEGERHIGATNVLGGTPWRAIWVSTVWLGMDHSFGYGPPLIYETMAFDQATDDHPWDDLCCYRYATEDQAARGHERTVREFQAQAQGWGWDLTQMRGAR